MNNNMCESLVLTTIFFDLCSDLHIEYWDKSLNRETYACSPKQFPLVLQKTDSDILVVAGDVSDDIGLSLEYLNFLSTNYKKVLFVDGNHEHITKYPNLFTEDEIAEKLKKIQNPKLVYLGSNNYYNNGTLFIGECGWWDYDTQQSREKGMNYFEGWIESLNNENSALKFMDNVSLYSYYQNKKMKQTLIESENDENINEIIIVTHTVPKKEFAVKSDLKIETTFQLQSHASDLLKVSSKVKMWIFGHTHFEFDVNIDGVRYLSHPRGRPEDFNREKYSFKKIINNKKN